MNLNQWLILSYCSAIVAVGTGNIRAQNQITTNSQNNREQIESVDAQGQNASIAATSAWNLQTTVGKIVADCPASARVFELVGIDYCCGGQESLAKAAKAKQVDANQLLHALLVVGQPNRTTSEKNWQQAALAELMDHIVEAHHNWLRRELPPLLSITQTVRRVHGDSHPELADIEKTLEQINTALLPHLEEEEETVFPAIKQLERGNPPAGMTNMLEALRADHDELGAELHRIRELTDGYSVPKGACAKYREMLTGLAKLERDMLQHVHLENNILLPRALALSKE